MDRPGFKSGISRRLVLQGMSLAGLTLAGGTQAAAARGIAKASGGFDPKRWWEQDYRIVQTNLREIDVRENPREIARAVREFGGNTIVSNIGGIVAFYPTKLQYQYKNPYLTGDFVAQMIEAAHAEGLAYIGRFDLSKGMKAAYDAHPDWFMLNRDGKPREYEGTYQACPNGGWAKEYGAQILSEALRKYRPDGVFFNMTGYPQTDYANINHGICVCENCRRTFRDMYGQDLPKVDGFADPAWRDYLDFQERTSDAVAKVAADLSAKLIPGVPITRFDKYAVVGRGEVQRRVSRAAPEWQYQSGEQCRTAMARHPGKPWSSTSAAHIDYPWRQATETAAYHLNRFAQMLAVGGKLDLYLMGSLAGQDDQSYLPPLAQLYKWEAANTAHYQGLSPAARVGLYHSEATSRFGGAAPYARYANGAWRGAYSALVDSRIPFQFVSGERAGDGTVKLRETFDVIVAPNVTLLPADEAKALDTFVDQGGLLIASGMFGAFDGRGNRVTRSAMAAFPTETYAEPRPAQGWSLDPTKGSFRFSGERVPIDALYFGGALRAGASDLVPFAPDQRFGPPEFSYAVPGDPARKEPGVITMTYGKGRTVHIPWLFDWQYYRDSLPVHQQLLGKLIENFSPPTPWTLTGDGAVELTAQRTAAGRTLLHVVNYAGQRNGRYDPAPKLYGFRLGLLRPATSSIAALVGEQALEGKSVAGDERVWFDLPPIGAFEAILI